MDTHNSDDGPSETEDLAYLLTLAIHKVNPEISDAETYEIVLMFLSDFIENGGLDERDAVRAGMAIKQTARKPNGLPVSKRVH